MTLYVLGLLGGGVLLTKAADELVGGAARLAVRLRISAVVVGAVVIGFGTSAPELLVSAFAAARGALDIGIGNVVGSNIANLTLILGVTAVILPLSIGSATLAREAPLATGAVVLVALLMQGGLGRWESLVLLVGLVGALAWILRKAASEDGELAGEVEEYVHTPPERSLGAEVLRSALGLAGTLVGAQLLVYGAQGIALEAGVGEGFVGLSVVALGTSLPELVTGIQAARRREGGLVVGNLLGSNMFNSLAVAGVAGLVGPGPLDPSITTTGAVAMVFVAGAVWLFMRTGRTVERWEAVALIVAYPFIVGLLAL